MNARISALGWETVQEFNGWKERPAKVRCERIDANGAYVVSGAPEELQRLREDFEMEADVLNDTYAAELLKDARSLGRSVGESESLACVRREDDATKYRHDS